MSTKAARENDPTSAKAADGENFEMGERALGISEEEVDYNVMGSFPASDPPSWTLGIAPRKQFETELEGVTPSATDPSHQNESSE